MAARAGAAVFGIAGTQTVRVIGKGVAPNYFAGAGTFNLPGTIVWVINPILFAGSGTLGEQDTVVGTGQNIFGSASFVGAGTFKSITIDKGVVSNQFVGTGILQIGVFVKGNIFNQFVGTGTFQSIMTGKNVVLNQFTGSGTLQSVMTVTETDSVSFTGSGTFQSIMTGKDTVLNQFTGSGVFQSITIDTGVVSNQFVGTGALGEQDTVIGTHIVLGSGSFVGVGAFQSIMTGKDTVLNQFTGSGTLQSVMTVTETDSVSFTGSGAFQSIMTGKNVVLNQFTGSGTLQSVMTVTETDSVSFTGSGAFQSIMTGKDTALNQFTGSGTFNGSIIGVGKDSSSFVGAGTLGEQDIITHAGFYFISASFIGSGIFAFPYPIIWAIDPILYSGSGSFSFAPMGGKYTVNPSVFGGVGNLQITARIIERGSASFVGAGTLQSVMTVTETDLVSFAGTGTFQSIMTGKDIALNQFTGSGTFQSIMTGKDIALNQFTGSGTFQSIMTGKDTVLNQFTGSGVFQSITIDTGVVSNQFVGTGALGEQDTVIGTHIVLGSGSFVGVGAFQSIMTGKDTVLNQFTGSGTLQSVMTVTETDSVSFTGSGAFQSIMTGKNVVLNQFTGSGTLQSVMTVTETDSVSFTGSGAFQSIMTGKDTALNQFTGSGTFNGSIIGVGKDSSSFVGAGTLGEQDIITHAGFYFISASFIGSGIFAFPYPIIWAIDPILYSGSGSFSFAPMGGKYTVNPSVFGGVGNLQITARIIERGSASFVGAGAFQKIVTGVGVVQNQFSGTGALGEQDTVIGTHIVLGSGSFTGSGAFQSIMTGKDTVLNRFTGSGTLNGSIVGVGKDSSLFVGVGTLGEQDIIAHAGFYFISASFVGSGNFAFPYPIIWAIDPILYSGSGSFSFAPMGGKYTVNPSAFSGAGKLGEQDTVIGTHNVFASGSFAGVGNLISPIVSRIIDRSVYGGAGTLRGDAIVVSKNNIYAHFVGAGVLSLPGTIVWAINPIFYHGAGTLHAEAEVTTPGRIPIAAHFNGATTLVAFDPLLYLLVVPPNPSIPDTTAPGTVVATLYGMRTDGHPFTGNFTFVAPNYSDFGMYYISQNGAGQPGSLTLYGNLGPEGGSIEHVTIVANDPALPDIAGYGGVGSFVGQGKSTGFISKTSFTGSGTMSADLFLLPFVVAYAHVVGSGTFVTAPTGLDTTGNIAFVGAGTFRAFVQNTINGSVGFVGAGAFNATVKVSIPLSREFSGTAELDTVPFLRLIGTGGSVGSGELAASFIDVGYDSAMFPGSGAIGIAVQSLINDFETFAGTGTLVAAPRVNFNNLATFNAVATLNNTAIALRILDTSGFTGTGTFSALTRDVGRIYDAFSGSGEFNAVWSVAGFDIEAAFSVAAGLGIDDTTIVLQVAGTTVFAGSGTVGADPFVLFVPMPWDIAASFVGASDLEVLASEAFGSDRISFTGAASFVVSEVQLHNNNPASFIGMAELDATSKIRVYDYVRFAGVTGLTTVGPQIYTRTNTSFVGAAAFTTATPQIGAGAKTDFAGIGTLITTGPQAIFNTSVDFPGVAKFDSATLQIGNYDYAAFSGLGEFDTIGPYANTIEYAEFVGAGTVVVAVPQLTINDSAVFSTTGTFSGNLTFPQFAEISAEFVGSGFLRSFAVIPGEPNKWPDFADFTGVGTFGADTSFQLEAGFAELLGVGSLNAITYQNYGDNPSSFTGSMSFSTSVIIETNVNMVFPGTGSFDSTQIYYNSGLAVFSGAGTLEVATTFGYAVFDSFIGTGTLIAPVTSLEMSEEVSFEGAGAVEVAAGVISANNPSSFDGAGTLIATSVLVPANSASFIGEGALLTAPYGKTIARMSFPGDGSFVGAGVADGYAAAVSVGVGHLTDQMTATGFIEDVFVGAGTLRVVGVSRIHDTGVFSGTTSFIAHEIKLGPGQHLLDPLKVTGVGTFRGKLTAEAYPVDTFTGVGIISVKMLIDRFTDSQFSGTGKLAAVSRVRTAATTNFAVAGSFSGDVVVAKPPVRADFIAHGSLIVQATAGYLPLNVPGSSDFAGAGTLVTPEFIGDLAGLGAFISDGVFADKMYHNLAGQIAILNDPEWPGEGELEASSVIIGTATGAFSGSGAFSVETILFSNTVSPGRVLYAVPDLVRILNDEPTPVRRIAATQLIRILSE